VGELAVPDRPARRGPAREPIAQTFAHQGDEFTVVGNRFKSKGSSGATGDNADTGQGKFNGDRTPQAQVLAGFVQQLQTESGDPDELAGGSGTDVLDGGNGRDVVVQDAPDS